MASKDVPKLSPEQMEELARCYCIWCGVLPDDDIRGEMKSARRQVRDMLRFFGKGDRMLAEAVSDDAQSRGLTYRVPPKIIKPFAVGEIVAICDRDGAIISRAKVKTAGKKVIRLASDLRSFRASDGYWIGEDGFYPFPSLRRLTSKLKREHAARVESERMAEWLDRDGG